MKASKPARVLGRLERRGVGIGQNMESKQASKGHSLAGEGRGWDWSEHGKQTSQQGTLTTWRGQRLGLVRTWKANRPARDTHKLERAEVGIGQNMESKQASKGHSHAGEGRGWDWSENGKQTSQQGTLTCWRGQRLGLVRKWKANKPARDTHKLERAEVGIGQNMESKQASKGHSLAGEGRGWDWSEYGKQTSQQGTLTCWRGQRLGLVRTWKATKPARDTHKLERAEVGIGQNMESKQASKGHSQTREGRGWDWSEHGKQTSQQGALTYWRGQRLGLVRTWKADKPARDTHTLERAEVAIRQNIES